MATLAHDNEFVLRKQWDDSRSTSPERRIVPSDISWFLINKTLSNASDPISSKIYAKLLDELQRKSKALESIEYFKESVKKNRNVVKIAYFSTGQIVTIWTFLKNFSRRSLYAVYNVEQKLIDKYPSLTFDFTSLISTAEPIPSHFTIENLRDEQS
jgi:hypothetical protein